MITVICRIYKTTDTENKQVVDRREGLERE